MSDHIPRWEGIRLALSLAAFPGSGSCEGVSTQSTEKVSEMVKDTINAT